MTRREPCDLEPACASDRGSARDVTRRLVGSRRRSAFSRPRGGDPFSWIARAPEARQKRTCRSLCGRVGAPPSSVRERGSR